VYIANPHYHNLTKSHHKPTPTPLHPHASCSISTTRSLPSINIKQGYPIHTSISPSWALEPTSLVSSPPSQCPHLQAACGTIACYDPEMGKCCENEQNICKLTDSCVRVQLHNGTIAPGCCPHGTLAYNNTCFYTTTLKCCAAPGGVHGLCSADQDCYGNMCCDEGAICVGGFGGPMCWQRQDNSTGKTEDFPNLPATTATPSAQKSFSSDLRLVSPNRAFPRHTSNRYQHRTAPKGLIQATQHHF
jgi:hypothetical protein